MKAGAVHPALVTGQTLAAPGVDIVLGHSPAQTRLTDPQIGRDLRDRVLTTAGQIHCSTPELRRLGCRHKDSSRR